MHVIGIDLGGTKLAGGLFTSQGDLLQKEVRPLDGRQGSGVGELIYDMIEALSRSARQQGRPAAAIGISVPGIAYPDTGTVWAPNIPGWEAYPLIEELRNKIGNSDLPILLESDRSCYILGEQWKGAAQGCRDAIYLAVGTGIGAGILAGGRILRGSGNIAGAIGWMALDRPFRAAYEACGCFEYHASGPGLVKVAKNLLEADAAYAGPLRDRLELDTKDIFEFFEKKDPVATQVMEEAIQFWGMAVANLVSIFNPEKIIFGGGVFGPATRFLDRIAAEAARWAQPVSMRQVSLEASQLGGDAGLIGAGFLALNALKQT